MDAWLRPRHFDEAQGSSPPRRVQATHGVGPSGSAPAACEVALVLAPFS
jgi:hypothetical protein